MRREVRPLSQKYLVNTIGSAGPSRHIDLGVAAGLNTFTSEIVEDVMS